MKCFLIFIWVAMGVLAEEPEGSSALKSFADQSVQYIGELYKQLLEVHPSNFFVSPLSVQTIFALVNGGAKGNTSNQITTSLRLPKGEEELKEIFLSLSKSLQTNPYYNLTSANKIYLANHFKINPQYKAHAADVFQSEIQNIDLRDSQKATAEINKWVANKTHEKIKNFVREDMLDKDTIAVLINALFFQGKWGTKFTNTSRGTFSGNNNEFLTDMMTIVDTFNYCNNSALKAQFLEMPYEGEDVTMTFVLPHELEGLSKLEAQISDVLITPKYKLRDVNATIPKFTIETTTKFIPILQALGIKDAFSKDANFSGIVEGQELLISDVVQKTFLEVDEKGTSAAAATGIDLINRVGEVRPLTFVANHPFIFYLKHRINGILFIGRYLIPEVVY